MPNKLQKSENIAEKAKQARREAENIASKKVSEAKQKALEAAILAKTDRATAKTKADLLIKATEANKKTTAEKALADNALKNAKNKINEDQTKTNAARELIRKIAIGTKKAKTDADKNPESVPINSLVRVPGTPLADSEPIDPFDFVRVIAVARITMPKARVRLSAGRQQMGEAVQALCFMAGANSIFYGDKLLTTDNPEANDDRALLDKLGLRTRGAVLESVQKESCGC
jgi:hypothetical protein